MLQMDVQRTFHHDGDCLSQVIIKASNSLDLLTFDINVTFILLVMAIICAKPFKKSYSGLSYGADRKM